MPNLREGNFDLFLTTETAEHLVKALKDYNCNVVADSETSEKIWEIIDKLETRLWFYRD